MKPYNIACCQILVIVLSAFGNIFPIFELHLCHIFDRLLCTLPLQSWGFPMAGNVLEVLLVDENKGGWVVLLLLITFGVLTVTSRAVLTLARAVVIMLVLRVVVVLLDHGGNVELAVTDVLPSGNTGNSSTFCTY